MQFLIDSKISVQMTFKTEPTIPAILDLFEYIENIQSGLPTCKIKLNCRDLDTLFISESLYDGAKVKVKINHAVIKFEYNLNFAIFGTPSVVPSKVTSEGYDITLYGILDNYKYLSGVAGNSYSGSVSSVLTTLAKECGLSANLLQTAENQVWYGHGRAYYNLARHLIDHCYLSGSSLPVIGVTHPNTLILRDIVDLLKKAPLHTLSYQTKVEYKDTEGKRDEAAIENSNYVFTTYQTKNVAGLYNSTGTYGSTFLQDSITDSKSFESKSVTFDRRIGNSEINKGEKGSIKEAVLTYMPLDVGGTYDNYYIAEAKNKRIRNLYSNVVKALVVNEYTRIRLLDTVLLSIDLKYQDAKDVTYSGNYIVTAKTLNITRNIFREAITLTNYGRNMKTTDLL